MSQDAASPMPRMADKTGIAEAEARGEMAAPHRLTDRSTRYFVLLTRYFAGIPPRVLQSMAETVTAGAQGDRSQHFAGLGHLLWRLRDNSHVLAVVLDPLDAVGQEPS
jgi:hypothetical protein